MDSFQRIHQLMTEIGPRANLSEVAEFTEDENWVLIVDEETMVSAELDSELGKLVFSADVAKPPAEKRFATYEFLLQFNHQWAETDGLRMALDGPSGMVVQIFDLPTADLDIQTLQHVVVNFIQQLGLWQQLVLEGVGAEEESVDGISSPDVRPGPEMMSGMIRA